MIDLRQGDCLEVMKSIADGSVDLILTDPPYGTMKGAEGSGIYGKKDNPKHDWDNVIDTDAVMAECNRILRVNGALLLFSQQPFTTELINKAHNNVPFSYCLTWKKDSFAFALGCKKFPVNYTEDICAFFKRHDGLALHPLRHYFKLVIGFIGQTKKAIVEKLGQCADHTLRVNSTQFSLCTEQTYNEIIENYEIDHMNGFLPFSELAEQDKAHKQTVKRTFNLAQGAKFKSNILEYKKDYNGYHPTQKPVALLTDLIKTYSNSGDTVLDFTMGSGSTGVACVNTNRKFIGIELDPDYFKIAEKRIHEATQ